MDDFGFIILRHCSSDIHTNYWKHCISSIRQFHNQKIIVIDDNSSIPVDNTIEYEDVTCVESEYKGAGEILGYHYGWKYRPFKNFIVMHDSMFLKNALDLSQLNNQHVIFLWHFERYLGQVIEYKSDDMNPVYIEYCDKSQHEALFNLYYNKSAWFGCFGVASMISLDFIDLLFKKYDLLNCITHVTMRCHREAIERVFALLCFLEEPQLKNNPSIFGSILTDYRHEGLKWHTYINNYNSFNNEPIIKLWSGR